jgi:hypothetical protein
MIVVGMASDHGHGHSAGRERMIMAARNGRPKVTLPSVAQHYAMSGERIIEVSSDGGGCLMSLRVIDGRLRIEVYRADDTVDVVAPKSDVNL